MPAPGISRPQSREVRAYAKVNLCLRVLGRRPDGYHDLWTVFQTVNLGDSVSVSMEPGSAAHIALNCDRSDIQGRDNLAWTAADLLLRRAGLAARVRIDIRKSVPSGAGLGGGSSDAAAVIRAMASMLDDLPADDLLLSVAAELGSDVPFFLVGGTAVGTGRGTELQPLPDLPPAALVVARPGLEVSTPQAYAALAEHRRSLTGGRVEGKLKGVGSRSASDSRSPLKALEGELRNDFEPVVFQIHPVIGGLKRRLRALGARQALMSGSGSAVFGVFESYRAAQSIAATLRAEGFEAWAARYVARAASGTIVEPAAGWAAAAGAAAASARRRQQLLGNPHCVE